MIGSPAGALISNAYKACKQYGKDKKDYRVESIALRHLRFNELRKEEEASHKTRPHLHARRTEATVITIETEAQPHSSGPALVHPTEATVIKTETKIRRHLSYEKAIRYPSISSSDEEIIDTRNPETLSSEQEVDSCDIISTTRGHC